MRQGHGNRDAARIDLTTAHMGRIRAMPFHAHALPCMYSCTRHREIRESWIKTLRRLLY